MFDNWIKRNFPTVPDNDKPIDKKYVIDTIKEYFGKPKTEQAKLQNDLLHYQYVGFQIGILVLFYGLYIWYKPFTILIDSNIPSDSILGTNIFLFLGFISTTFMLIDYIGNIVNTRKKIKEIEKGV